jgi:hypothetical protein
VGGKDAAGTGGGRETTKSPRATPRVARCKSVGNGCAADFTGDEWCLWIACLSIKAYHGRYWLTEQGKAGKATKRDIVVSFPVFNFVTVLAFAYQLRDLPHHLWQSQQKRSIEHLIY